MKKIALILGLLVLGIGLIVVLGLLSLGYMPGLGQNLGLGGPKDLGVEYTEADYQSAKDKIATDTRMVKASFTDEELTALLNSCSGETCMLESVQVKTSANGNLEFSGVIQKDNIEAFLASISVDGAETADLEPVLAYLPPSPTFYAQATLQGSADSLAFTLQSAEVASVPVPENVMAEIDAEIERAINDYLASLEGTQLNTIHVTEGEVYIDAALDGVQL